MPLRQSAKHSAWGLPTVVPEVILLYKATTYFAVEELTDRRPQDEPDFLAPLPHLAEKQRRWLQGAVSLAHPGHPWLTQLSL